MKQYQFPEEDDRPLDWQDKLVIAACIASIMACAFILIWWRPQ